MPKHLKTEVEETEQRDMRNYSHKHAAILNPPKKGLCSAHNPQQSCNPKHVPISRRNPNPNTLHAQIGLTKMLILSTGDNFATLQSLKYQGEETDRQSTESAPILRYPYTSHGHARKPSEMQCSPSHCINQPCLTQSGQSCCNPESLRNLPAIAVRDRRGI